MPADASASDNALPPAPPPPPGAPSPPPPAGRVQELNAGHLVLGSDFDSGNLWRAELRDNACAAEPPSEWRYNGWRPAQYPPDEDPPYEKSGTDTLCELWVAPDCFDSQWETSNRSWFHFSVRGGKAGERVIFRVMNTNPHAKLFEMDMRPVWRHAASSSWERVLERVTHHTVANNGVLDIPFTFEGPEPVFICFTYPYPLAAVESAVALWKQLAARHPEGVSVTTAELCKSVDGHPVHEVVISKKSSVVEKKKILLSARVHPCETPASYVLEGYVQKLLTPGDNEMMVLLNFFDFHIVPCLNPDGVQRGHCRNDPYGKNLNRFYKTPCPEATPTVHVMKTLFTQLHSTGRLFYYIDMHAHHSKRGFFLYGNHLGNQEHQVETQLLPKLMHLVTPHFHLAGCNFSKSAMSSAGGKDGTKEGSARVSLYQASGFPFCYTLETNYNTSNITDDTSGKIPPSFRYTPESWRDMGRSVVAATAALVPDTPPPLFLSSSPLQDIAGVRKDVANLINEKNNSKSAKVRRKINPQFVKAQEAAAAGEAVVVASVLPPVDASNQ